MYDVNIVFGLLNGYHQLFLNSLCIIDAQADKIEFSGHNQISDEVFKPYFTLFTRLYKSYT